MDLQEIFFYFFSFMVLGIGSITAFSKNLLRAAFALFFVLFGMAGFYILLGADFLAIVQILVYAGGISVLLIFGTMLTGDVSKPEMSSPSFHGVYTFIIGIAFLTLILGVLKSTKWSEMPISTMEPTTNSIGKLLLTEYLLPFEVVSFLLLAAMIGALVLIIKKESHES